MKPYLLTLLAACALAAAPAAAQTVKTLGYNATNGFIVYSGTNALTFTNSVGFATNARAATRTNLGLGATWLTNTAASTFRQAIDLGQGSEVYFGRVFYNVQNTQDFWFYVKDYEIGNYDPLNEIQTPFLTFAAANVSEEWVANSVTANVPISFVNSSIAATTRANLGIPLPALTNTSNALMMRALAGSTNTNQPFSGSISVVGTNNTNTLVFSNGILLSQ
jgi:hypothetical protein